MKQKRKWIKIIHNAEKYKYIDRGEKWEKEYHWELDDDANKTKKEAAAKAEKKWNLFNGK